MNQPIILLPPEEKRNAFDLVVEPRGWPRTRIIASLAGARVAADVENILLRAGPDEWNKTLSDLKSNGAQGLVAVVQGEENSRTVTIWSLGEQPAGSALLLEPGRHPREIRLPLKKPRSMVPGACIVAPADQVGENGLRKLRQALAAMPGDLELLVLDSLRRPDLEERVGRLERKVGGVQPTAHVARRWYRRWWRVWADRLARPLSVRAFLVWLLLLALLVWAPARMRPSAPAAGAGEPADTLGEEEQSTVPAATSAPASAPQQAYDHLIKALQRSEDESIRELYRTHFENHGDEADPALGVFKLGLWHSNPNLDVGLGDPSPPPLALGKIEDTVAAWSPQALAGVTFVTCSELDDPDIPWTDGEKIHLPFSCPPEAALAEQGLRELGDFVETREWPYR